MFHCYYSSQKLVSAIIGKLGVLCSTLVCDFFGCRRVGENSGASGQGEACLAESTSHSFCSPWYGDQAYEMDVM